MASFLCCLLMLTTLFNFAFSNSYRSCQCMQYNSGKGTCYYFTNKEAGACSSRQCEPSYVCDKKGLLLCREKTYPTKIVPHGNGYCKEVQYQTVKLEPYASVVKPGVPLVFRTARAQSIDQGGDPMRVIRSQHQCVWPGSCMMTKVGTSPWFLGYLRDISRVSSITLTFRRDREFYRKQPQLRVYVDGFQCTPERRPTYDNPKVKYDCGDAIGYRVIVYLPGKNQVLSFCGIDAIGTPVQKSSIKFAPQSATSSGHLYGVSPNNVFTLPHKQKWTGTCYHSTRSNYPWWRAHLAQRSIVQTILIYARSDNFASALHRYKGLQVYADRTACTLVKWSSKEAILYYQCQDVPVATTITVKSALKNEYLHICGVDVYGFAGPATPTVQDNMVVPGRPNSFQLEIAADALCWVFYNGEHIGDCHDPGYQYRFVSLIPRTGDCPVITIKAMGGSDAGFILGRVVAGKQSYVSSPSWLVSAAPGSTWMSTNYNGKDFKPSTVLPAKANLNSTSVAYMKKTGAQPVWLSTFKKGAKAYFRVPIPGCK